MTSRLIAAFLIACVSLVAVMANPTTRAIAATPAAVCTASEGPGIPPPVNVPSGIPGFHAAWYGQSGYPTLCPGQRSTAVVAYYNSGSFGWVSDRMGEMAFLGTWDPVPGQDKASQLGGTDTGWPRFDRIAAQPADYVGPGQIAWFQFTIQAPATPGTYLLYLRPLIEGATWMEDYGVFWQVTVKAADTNELLTVTPTSEGDAEVATTRQYSATVSGAPGCVDLAFVDAPGLNFEGQLRTNASGTLVLSSAATFANVNGAAASGSYVDCVPVSSGQVVTFLTTSNEKNAYVQPIVFRDLNSNNILDGGEPWGIGGPVRFVPPEATAGGATVVVGVVSADGDYFTDAAATATYRYDFNDVFQRSGVTMGLTQFEQLLSRGDTVAVSYQADGSATSVFNITDDRGGDAPTVEARVDSWDSGPTQNDIGIRITEPPTNVDRLTYSVQRAPTGFGLLCGDGSGIYAQIATISIGSGSDTTLYADDNLAVGTYCYRVGAADPVTGGTAFGYSQHMVITNPPPLAARPRALDARVTTSAGAPAFLDTGDVVKIAFDKVMQSPVGRQMQVRDADGTIANVRCLQSEQACTLNPGPEALGGVTYPANTVITITMRTQAPVVAAGATAGLQLNVTVTTGDFSDDASNAWDINASDDVILGAPD